LNRIGIRIRRFFEDLRAVNRQKATQILELEVKELENIFGLLIFGSFVGIPSPPVYLTLDLLPTMEDELELLLMRTQIAHDPLGELLSTLGEP
jgi:hypothetical protein